MLSDDIDTAAADWLARLDRADVPETLRIEFEAWCRANPRHQAAYLRLQEVWERLDGLRGLRPQVQAAAAGTPPVRSRRSLFASVAVAAALMFATIVLWVWLWPQSFSFMAMEKRYATPLGGFERLALADGSVLQLNTDSVVRVMLQRTRREVELIQGEATFKVAKDASRPFIVRAGSTAVRAVGTSFNVHKTASGLEVMIMEGAVAVGPAAAMQRPDALPVVGAGQLAVADSSQVRVKNIDDAEVTRRLAWQRGMLGFNGQSLAEVTAEFNRYNETRLVIADPALAELRIGGYFRATNVEAFVRVIEERFGVAATREERQIELRRAAH